jgi:IclR family acetate operon transcriptional repressor
MTCMGRRHQGTLDSPTAKIMAVLDAVARLANAPVSQVAEHTGLPASTAYRICVELERLGHLQRVPATRNWTVARPLVDLAASALTRAATSAATSAILTSLAREIGEMTSFAVQLDDHVLYIASAEPPQELTLSFRAGRKAPLFCTSSGRLFLARLDDEALDQYLRNAELPAFTRYTNTDARKLRAELMNIRNRRYAITRQEYILHVVGAAVPVESGSGVLYGALSIAAPDVRMDGAGLKRAIPVLVAASNKLANSLAFVPSSAAATRGSAKRATSAAGRCSTRPTPS